MTKSQAPVALVTGGARRIGAAIVELLHQKGYRVIIHSHQNKDAANALAAKLNALRSDSACALTADLSHHAEANQLIDKSVAWANSLHVLVNNASRFIRTQDCHAVNETIWQDLFSVNVQAPYWLSCRAYPYLAKTQGTIINITDIHAEKPLTGYSVYCQSKAALAMQTKALAREFAPSVRVNAVAPGAITWPEGENALAPSVQQKIIANTPLRRHGDPSFIAQAVLTLAENPFITGETLAVDGGRKLL